MKRFFLLLPFCFFLQARVFAQKPVVDSLSKMLKVEGTDTGKVKLMWKIATAMNTYDPDKALEIGNNALLKAQEIKYLDGQSKSLESMVQALRGIGNYPRALEYGFRKLQIEEKRNRPLGISTTLITIGNVYNVQKDFDQARIYYLKSDSVNQRYNLFDNYYYTWYNLGDLYNKTNNYDSAFYYFNRSLERAMEKKDEDLIGTSRTGLGHVYLKKEDYLMSLANYRSAISNLQVAGDDELLCEARLGLARLYQKTGRNDSAIYYSSKALFMADEGGFTDWQLECSKFLSKIYSEQKNMDSAYFYLVKVQALNDTLNSKSRIKESMVISSNEHLRQLELEENRKLAQKERETQLQYLFIAIFIPGLFLLTLLLSSIRINIKVVKLLGIISLLILFEYLTLLLHPYVANVTNHMPVYELLIFVSIAALLIPFHHRFEYWLITKLTRHNDRSIRIKKQKLSVKGPTE